MAVYEERIPQVKQIKPKRKGNRRVLFLLLLFFLLVLAVLFFRSSYSKVAVIEVTGNVLYTKEEITAASGLAPGMQFFNVWQKDVQENLKQLAGVKSITVSRKFPGVIRLDVIEYKRVAFLVDAKGDFLPLLENGVHLDDNKMKANVIDDPLVRNWTSPELLPELSAALAKLPVSIRNEISEIALTPTPYDKQRLTLYMRDGNEVRTVIYQLAERMAYYPAIASDIPEGKKGVINMLEATWFSEYAAPKETEGSGDQQQGQTDQPDKPDEQKESQGNEGT
ncbi:cell division protein FtsQ/DivIB [Brevibacillus sp. B_LB10_24]|uniref:cell division protein FtsQ/DivIB n=1 Tax=Brevibacillus sp. B_LB10_24 TaxID=3380645 RepID=UPI0038B7B5EE